MRTVTCWAILVACWTILSLTWTASRAATPESSYHSSEPRAVSAKRHMVDCMNRQMTASRTLSYNEASRICKDQLKDQLIAQQAPLGAPGTAQKAVSAP